MVIGEVLHHFIGGIVGLHQPAMVQGHIHQVKHPSLTRELKPRHTVGGGGGGGEGNNMSGKFAYHT